MALLCTLHADGPKTLRILREAGCTTVEKLRSLESDRLARLLGLTPAAARRLLREAVLLEERLEPALEREEVMYPPAAHAAAMKPAPPGFLGVSGEEEPSVQPEQPRSALDLRDRNLLDRVVDRWRKADQRARGESSDSSEPEQNPASEIEPRWESPSLAEVEVEIEIPTPPQRGHLRPGQLGGLDQETCDRLVRGGIASLEELATCPIDDLVARTELSFTRARTLQFLAGRRLTETEEGASPAPPEPGPIVEPPREPVLEQALGGNPERQVSISGGRSGLSEEGAGGPFA